MAAGIRVVPTPRCWADGAGRMLAGLSTRRYGIGLESVGESVERHARRGSSASTAA